MTPPIPEGAPRKRGGRACIPCRAAKCKCEPDCEPGPSSSAPSSEFCSRCTKLGIVCEYAPNRRLGRPRRLPVPRPYDREERTALQVSLRTSDSARTHANVLPPSPSLTPGLIGNDVVNSFYRAILNEYKQNVHPYIPILPSDELELERTIRFAPPLLLNAILGVTYPHEANELSLPIINPVLSELQAAALLTLVYYGRGENDNARTVLERATGCLVTVQSAVPELLSSGDLMPPTPRTDLATNDTTELWRRLWWECWALEIILACVTGVNSFVLSQNSHQSELLQLSCSSYSSSGIADQLYIQSIAFLRECITVPINPGGASMEHLAAVSTIGANIFTLARQQWPKQVATDDSSQSKLAASVRREKLFIAGSCAACSVIHLHTTSFASCLFACGVDITVSPPEPSLTYILNSARSAFDFLRDAVNHQTSLTVIQDDSEKSFGWPPNPSPHDFAGSFPQHSPFFACCYLVAAQGTILALDNRRGMPVSDLSLAAIATDFQMAEWVIKTQTCRWTNSRPVLDEMQRLLGNMQTRTLSTRRPRRIVGCPPDD